MAPKVNDPGRVNDNQHLATSQDALINTLPFLDFKSASHAVLRFLQHKIGFDLWMLTRAEGRDWIILQAQDAGYGMATPMVLRWADSFCVHMVQGRGPQVAPSSDLVPAYASAPIGKQFPIGAYIGVPLIKDTGALFGTLCAIHPVSQPEAVRAELPLVTLLSQLLSSLLQTEQALNTQVRLTERAETEALNDPLTGCYNPLTELYNGNGWWQLLDAEEDRCASYGSPAWVFAIEINVSATLQQRVALAHDEGSLLRVSRAFYEATHPEDIIAQIGENEYAILAVECHAEDATALLHRLRSTCKNAGMRIAVGYAARHPAQGLRSAWQKAREALERDKKAQIRQQA